MNEKINFALVFHFHQPIGNFDHVIEHAYQKSYLPLIEMIKKFPKIKVGLHYTGYLLEWLEKNHPEYFDILIDMSKKGQIEIIGGAYYEPIISVIPDRDKKGQIKLLTDYIKNHFNLDVKGFWLAERAWEPHLPKILNESDIEYILIDDFHLRANGLFEEETFFPYFTEEQGYLVKVMPINEPLRYMVPWNQPWEPIEYLEKHANLEGDRLITLISDAEKMGVWPAGDMTTYDICYVKGYDGTPWLESWFSRLTAAMNDWLIMLHIGEYLKKYKPKGLIYMPAASYDKMSFWVLPTPARRTLENLIQKAKWKEFGDPFSDELLQFLKGGYWRGFFVKYPESNLMHKKMLHVREKLINYEKKFGKTKELDEIWLNIYKSQTNDPYWHGQFGGVYFSFMRETIFSCLIDAEMGIDNLLKQKNQQINKIYAKDLTFDGRPEILLENESLNVYVQPHYGASILEIDVKNALHNISNVFTRKEEAYHPPNSNFPVDRWRKQAFIDHFIQDGFTLNQLRIPMDELKENSVEKKVVHDKFEDLGNFAGSEYTHDMLAATVNQSVKLTKKGKIKNIDVTINKKITLKSKTIEIEYEIESAKELKTFHYVEFPIFVDSDISQNNVLANGNKINVRNVSNWKGSKLVIKNLKKKLSMSLSTQNFCNFLIYPLMTYVSTDGGYDSLYQGTVMGLQAEVDLIPNESYKNAFVIEFKDE